MRRVVDRVLDIIEWSLIVIVGILIIFFFLFKDVDFEEIQTPYEEKPVVELAKVCKGSTRDASIIEANPMKEPEYLIEITDEEIDLMARVVMSEASICPFETKQAIAQVIVNRVRDTEYEFRYEHTVSDVVGHINGFSTQNNGEPNEDCYEAVYAALTYEVFPRDMMWFREGRYHDFYEPYLNIGTTYFTTFKKWNG